MKKNEQNAFFFIIFNNQTLVKERATKLYLQNLERRCRHEEND